MRHRKPIDLNVSIVAKQNKIILGLQPALRKQHGLRFVRTSRASSFDRAFDHGICLRQGHISLSFESPFDKRLKAEAFVTFHRCEKIGLSFEATWCKQTLFRGDVNLSFEAAFYRGTCLSQDSVGFLRLGNISLSFQVVFQKTMCLRQSNIFLNLDATFRKRELSFLKATC